jgi:hypothetical protein
MEWISAALIANPQIAAAEAELLTSFSTMEKALIIRNLFEPITNHYLLMHALPDLMFSLCNTLQDPDEAPMLEFLLAAAPEWSVRRNFVPSTLQAEEQLITTTPHHLPSLRGNLALANTNHPIPNCPELSTLTLPLPLPYFLMEPVSSNTLQFLGIPSNPTLRDAKSFLSFLQLDPLILLGGCYSSFRTPSRRRIALVYGEAFLLFIRGFPDFPSEQVPANPEADDTDSDTISTSSDSSSISNSSDFNSEDDIIEIIKLV